MIKQFFSPQKVSLDKTKCTLHNAASSQPPFRKLPHPSATESSHLSPSCFRRAIKWNGFTGFFHPVAPLPLFCALVLFLPTLTAMIVEATDAGRFTATRSLALAAFVSDAWAQGPSVGKIVHFRGQVDLYSVGSQSWKPAQANQLLSPGDVIQTGPTGWAAVLLADETLLQLNRNSRFILRKVAVKAGWDKNRGVLSVGAVPARSEYRVEKGEIWIRNKNRDININIESPTVTAAIRGTELNLKIGADETATLTVMEGRVQASNALGAIEVGVREQVVARRGQPLVKNLLLTPDDAVQWTIPMLFLYDSERMAPDLEQVIQMIQAGDLTTARERLSDVLRKRPQDASALQLSAIVFLMLGQKTAAADAAGKAVAAVPGSVPALLTQSYAYQAAFDLDQALAAVKKALAIDAGNVPALVQYAQLRFGMNDIDDAQNMIVKAVRLAPDNGAAQNLRGYILLAENKTEAAIAAFKRAGALDPGNGEPHMGLGLAYMRQGKTPEAFEEMSSAVLLEPRRSLFVTYWGKMLYQIERYDRALDMLNMAVTLDPLDPTPELYRAIILRDLNRPTEAIGAVNQAIKLNDNRAVYRSRFLLDNDRAVKNVDQAILYDQLGLLEWATSKATASIKDDFTNSSAHLFLAGSLKNAADRSWSMQNEYLLARMLMPANMNSFNTFNEYTSFFERPSFNITASGTVGSDARSIMEIIPYGAIPAANLAFGALLSYDRNDGWRESNGERTGNLVTIVKWDVTAKDSLMGVFSRQSGETYDKLSPRYEYDDPAAPNDWNENGVSRFEFGYHRRISSDSDLLFYVARLKNEGKLHQAPPTAYGFIVVPPRIDYAQDQIIDYRYLPSFWQVQGQYMHLIGKQQLIMGTNQYWGDNNSNLSRFSDTKYYDAGTLVLDDQQQSETYYNGPATMQSYYLLDTIRINACLTAEGALYLDRMTNSDAVSGTSWTMNEFGPRLGLILTPTKTDTIRLAAYRYLLPFISSRLDPTDIAGISVLRNNEAGAVIAETDAVWEHEWSSGFVSAGLFYSEKTYDYRTIDAAGATVPQKANGRNKGGEAKLNQLIGQGVGLNASYLYQDVMDERLFSADRQDQLVSVGLRYVHPWGISAGLTQIYRHTHLTAQNRNNEEIWITDGKISYEFPRKKGSLGFEIRNIFNQHFNWVTDYFSAQGRWPSREVFFTMTLNI